MLRLRDVLACVLVVGCSCSEPPGVDAGGLDANDRGDATDLGDAADLDGALDLDDASDASVEDSGEAPDGPIDAAGDSGRDAETDGATACMPGTSRDCATACGSTGAQSCDSSGVWATDCVAPNEVCGNGVDDDCDGVVDPTFGRIGPAIAVSEMPADFAWQGASSPRIAWIGTAFAVVWADDRTPDTFADVFLAQVPRGGPVAWRRYVIGGVGDDVPTALVWNGSRLGVGVGTRSVGGATRDVALHIVTDVGASRGSASPSAGAADSVSVAWASDRFALAWCDARAVDRDVFRAAYDATSSSLVSPAAIDTAAGSATGPSVAWNGTDLAIVWSDARTGGEEIHFARLAPDGSLIGTIQRVTVSAGASVEPTIAWNGTEYGVFWADDRDGSGSEIYFAALDASGARIGAESRITNAPGVARGIAALWSGAFFVVSWADARSGSLGVYATRVRADGIEIGDDLAIGSAGVAGTTAMSAVGPSEVGLAWDDDSTGRREVRLARIGLCR